MNSHAPDIFCEMCDACKRGVQMQPRSANDKEYFAQDWFVDRLTPLGLPCVQQGRNSYPDFWVGESEDREGFEIKSLASFSFCTRAGGMRRALFIASAWPMATSSTPTTLWPTST